MAAEQDLWEDLPAPDGWKKKVAQRRGGTHKRGDITFVAPNGEELKNKRQLEKYLKLHPPVAGAPQLADFDWSTGETPRRSERLSLRMKRSDELFLEPASPTSPTKRARMKKLSSTFKKPSAADKTEEEEAGAAADGGGGTGAAAGAATATAMAEDDDEETNKVPPISCATTETLANAASDAHPAQIGVSS